MIKKLFEGPYGKPGIASKTPKESYYEYLRDSERPIIEFIRNFMEKWFEDYQLSIRDTNKINDLCARLRDNNQFFGAFTELYTFALLKSSCVGIIADPESNKGKKPDFLVKKPNGYEFYVEVTTLSDGKFSNDREKAIKLVVDKVIRKVKLANYRIDLRWFGKCLENDLNKQVLREIQEWIDNPNNSLFKREFIDKREIPWTLEIEAIPVSDSDKDKSIVRFCHNPKVQCYSDKEFQTDIPVENVGCRVSSIRKTLEKKAAHYGDLGKPYFIVLNILTHVFESEAEDAILGSSTVLVNTEDGSASRDTSNYFFSKHTNVNGVLFCFNLKPEKVMGRYKTIIHDDETQEKQEVHHLLFVNPNAKQEFDLGDFKLLFDEVQKNILYRLNSTKLLRRLGLDQKR